MENSIVAKSLSKRFGGHVAVKDLSFEINKGEIVGFLGPNGAGKSTTLRILTGILPATSGYLSVCGKSVPYHPDEIKKFIGYMPENNPLPEHMRVIEYLRFRAQIKGIPFRQRKAAIERALEVCELHRKARRKIIGTLSKGFRQRVGIADAILASPAITILDEPTIGLDPHQVIAIRRLLATLRGETTVLFSSHILSEVEISCDRVLILNQGRLVAQGTPEELRKQFLPGSRYRAEISGGREQVMQALRKLGDLWEIQIQPDAGDDVFSVNLVNPNNGQHGESVLKQLIHSDRITIRQFQAVKPSLEDIFLTATRRSWELSGDENKETAPPFPANT